MLQGRSVQSTRVDHQRRRREHHRGPDQASHGKFASVQSPLQRAHRRLNRSAHLAIDLANSAALKCYFDGASPHIESRPLLPCNHAAALTKERTAFARAEGGLKELLLDQFGTLTLGAGHRIRIARGIELPLIGTPIKGVCLTTTASDTRRTQRHLVARTDRRAQRTGIASITGHLLDLNAALLLLIKRLLQQLCVIGLIIGHRHVRDQLHRVLGRARLADIGDIALVALTPLVAITRLLVMGRLQAPRTRTCFTKLRTITDDRILIGQNTLGQRTRLATGARELNEQLAQPLEMFILLCVRNPPADALGSAIEVKGQPIREGPLLLQEPVYLLNHRHEQLQPRKRRQIAQNLRAVDALPLRLELVTSQLFIGHLSHHLGEKIHPRLSRVIAYPATKIVKAAQLEKLRLQRVKPQGITHLQVETAVIVELLVAPAKTALENLQTHQHIHRHIRPRDLLTVEHRKEPFIDTAEDFLVEGRGPGTFQALAQLLRQKRR